MNSSSYDHEVSSKPLWFMSIGSSVNSNFVCLFIPNDVHGILSIVGLNEAILTWGKSSLSRSSIVGIMFEYESCEKNF